MGLQELGGAIFADDDTDVLIGDSSFSHNTAFAGGAINLGRSASLDLVDTDFVENQADSRGGAIRMGGEALLNITGGLFEEQFAKAGAAIVIQKNGFLTVDGADFEYNTSVGRGGAIWALWNTETYVHDTQFVGNSANFGYGGAIQAWGPIRSESNYFKANFSRLWGGGIYVYGAGFSDEGSVFSDNTTTNNYGGGLAVEEAGYLHLKDSQFIQNNGAMGGGIAALDAGDFSVRNVLFDDNFASNSGGAIFARETITHIVHSTFTENISGRDGGAIYSEIGQRSLPGSLRLF